MTEFDTGARSYMRLPVDADGVPIHCGDRIVCNDGRVREVWLIGTQDIMTSDHVCHDWAKCRHVKPRTVEDVLRELVDDALDGTGRDPLLKDWSALIAKYTAEIRELLGGAE